MKFSRDNIYKRLKMMPMILVLVPMILGIVVSNSYSISSLLLVPIIIVALWWAYNTEKSGNWDTNLALFLALFALGALRMNADAVQRPVYWKSLDMTLQFDTHRHT